jgi:hypothetical protein
MVSVFEGNKAETKTMLPVIQAFMAAHGLPDVTVVADAGMVSEANQKAIEAAGLSFILGMKIPHLPYVVAQWRREHPGEDIPDGHVFTQPWPAGPSGGRRDQVIYYQYRHDRARRTLRGIDEQVKKAEQAVAGKTPVKRNRFVQLSGGTRTVNRGLEERPGRWPGSRATSRTCGPARMAPRSLRSSSSAPTISSSRSRSHSGWPKATCRPGRSTTASATRSRRT